MTKPASESKYAEIIALVQKAESERAPLVRLADRYSVYFTVITFVIAAATWFLTHDIVRVIAVLVVATPCPLILATPIALISGMSRAAGRGVIVKGGGALEKLAEVRTMLFDKTGTVTIGVPKVESVFSFHPGNSDEILRVAASLDQLSAHILASSVVSYAKSAHVSLVIPEQFSEQFGDGVSGTVEGKKYYFGKLTYVSAHSPELPIDIEHTRAAFQDQGKIVVYLADEGHVLGYVVFVDAVRDESKHLFKSLHSLGIKNIILLTGDRKQVAEHVGKELGIEQVYAECLPDKKLQVVKSIPKNVHPTAMLGDGVNDAPAMLAADVGIALGTHGKTAASDSADIVILAPSLLRVRDVLEIARRTVSDAKQGILVGIGLSVLCMILGGFGVITPVVGAFLQEAIDVLVILNALRVGVVKKPNKTKAIV